ncbi:ImmA/IrrE family metallo-endopeptidase [Microvirga sp. 3-52]|uniref:ImmA/IrrE family metallo-endopeptidase n=1 Tax=Microvirga sp. 3-52 TaxID=2792425 RepID=UPI00289C36C8|nr:ImmA/IrrE family metallo-endopeptidase [Microvirga sp. 3-52]
MVQVSNLIPANISKTDVEDFAVKAIEIFKFQPGDPIEPLVAKLGGRTEFRSPSLGEKGSEAIRVEPDGKFVIYLSSITSAKRDRFTIAHELGHLFLHFPKFKAIHPDQTMVATRWVNDTDEEQRRAEWEANWFAAAFLMPAKAFEREFRLRGDLKHVASFFRVSTQAAEVRARSLQLM